MAIFSYLGSKARREAPAAHAVIDKPAAKAVVDRFVFPVEGWIWFGAEQDRVAAVEAWSGPVLLGETALLFPRPDVSAALGLPPHAATGFKVVAGNPEAARGASFDMAVRVRYTDGSRSGALCSRAVVSLGFDEAQRPALTPPSPEEVRDRASAADSLPLPPDPLQVRQVGGVWGASFYREGRVIFQQLAAAFAQAGVPLERARSILDFGCGCGRVLSAFADIPRAGEVWGCDIDRQAIEWNGANLSALGAFRTNASVPPSPFANGQFDAIYSVSVFTHLPEEMQFAWLGELRRILRPGGILVASVHGGHYSRGAQPEVRAEVAERGFAYRTGPVTEGLPDFYMVAVHSEAYIRATWTRFFELVAIHERLIHGVHDAIVLRRTAD
jgi:SAM-dependent methyltransferase